jgi:phosphate butyryltransferase
MPVSDFAALLELARHVGPRRVAVVAAQDDTALTALAGALPLGIATAVLVGDEPRVRQRWRALAEAFPAAPGAGEAASAGDVAFLHEPDPERAAAAAVALARAGEADILLKGKLRTDQLLRAVLAPDGLRAGRLLSDVLLYEDTLAGHRRLVAVTDGGINVAPDLEQLAAIVANAVQLLRALGHTRPRVALMSATEAVTPAVPSTVAARALAERAAGGEFGACEVFGPLALDNALLASAARAKGIDSPVAGAADALVLPNIEAGNVLGKAVKYLGGSPCGHVVVGARVPVLIPSRVESAEDKLNSIALGVVLHGH